MRVGIFGADQAGRFLYDEVVKFSENIEILGFMDNKLKGEMIQNVEVYSPEDFFSRYTESIDAVFLAAGAQKSIKEMIDTTRSYNVDNIYMLHDIAGKCKLSPFLKNGSIIPNRLRKIKFSTEKPTLPYFEVPVTDICNLNCKGCILACNAFTSGSHIELEQLKKDGKRMSEIFFDIPWIRIFGGEPLLHPEIIEILKSYRSYFPDSELDLCTNGLLIPKMGQEFWECIKMERISIHVSGYKPTYHMLDKIDAILDEQGIPYAILKREKFWTNYTDKPNNDMEKSFKRCTGSGCREVYRGKITMCPAMVGFQKLNKEFGASYQITENIDFFDIHDPKIDIWKVMEKFDYPINLCKYCSDAETKTFDWDYAPKKPILQDYIMD